MRAGVAVFCFGAALSGAAATTSQTPAVIETTGVWSFDGSCASSDGHAAYGGRQGVVRRVGTGLSGRSPMADGASSSLRRIFAKTPTGLRSRS